MRQTSLPPLPLRAEDLFGRVLARERFAELASLPEPEIDLFEGALCIAREEYPAMDARAYHLRIQDMVKAVRRRLPAAATPRRILETLNEYLYAEESFRGDRETYYDPRNSFLNEVIDRHKGIPITLSVLYLVLGRQLGLPLHGINFPGHFLIAYRDADHDLLIDAYEEGRTLTLAECEARVKTAQGPRASLHHRMLIPTGPRQMLYRILNNLKGIYLRTDEPGRALSCAERMLLLVPDSPIDQRDRGMLLMHFDFPLLAQRDLEAYLLAKPSPDDAGAVFERLKQLNRRNRLAS
ncbi:MAG: transglutaminase-like domain-containing protein [Acidobacteriota bacterium]